MDSFVIHGQSLLAHFALNFFKQFRSDQEQSAFFLSCDQHAVICSSGSVSRLFLEELRGTSQENVLYDVRPIQILSTSPYHKKHLSVVNNVIVADY